MLKPKNNLINAKISRVLTNDSINIDSGSVVFDNKWINYKSTVFNVTNYITSVLVSPRTRFFQNRNYTVFLLIGLTKQGDIQVVEGTQVEYTGILTAPPPTQFDILPLIGIILIQDGSSDLNYGFKNIQDSNIILFSGTGNIIDKNLEGIKGPDSDISGETGVRGLTGPMGDTGIFGNTGSIGHTGPMTLGDKGLTGIRGITGINWTIHFPLEFFF